MTFKGVCSTDIRQALATAMDIETMFVKKKIRIFDYYISSTNAVFFSKLRHIHY